jgi:hypothetical protein
MWDRTNEQRRSNNGAGNQTQTATRPTERGSTDQQRNEQQPGTGTKKKSGNQTQRNGKDNVRNNNTITNDQRTT